MAKHNWKDYFTFSKKERNGAIIFLAVIGGVIAFPLFFTKNKKEPSENTADKNLLAELPKDDYSSNDDWKENAAAPAKINTDALHSFDPNTISKEEWIKFGLPEKTANTIINYTSKGGRFYKSEDIRKIWGLRPEEADALIPFINIPNSGGRNTYQRSGKNYPVIDINKATAEEWKALPGIGDVLSERIVKFRTTIGGFSSIEDIKKVYGISDATFELIQPYLRYSGGRKKNYAETNDGKTTSSSANPNAFKGGKVNINAASERDMISAGIPRNIARGIVVYREDNGRFSKIEDVKKIIFIDEDAYEKIAPLIVAE